MSIQFNVDNEIGLSMIRLLIQDSSNYDQLTFQSSKGTIVLSNGYYTYNPVSRSESSYSMALVEEDDESINELALLAYDILNSWGSKITKSSYKKNRGKNIYHDEIATSDYTNALGETTYSGGNMGLTGSDYSRRATSAYDNFPINQENIDDGITSFTYSDGTYGGMTNTLQAMHIDGNIGLSYDM